MFVWSYYFTFESIPSMQLKNLISLSLIAMVIFSSCQKEVDPALGRTTDNTSDSIYLKQYTELDASLPPGSDTILKANIFYDAQKRAVKLTDYNFSFDAQTVIDFFYSGSDTLPYKSIVYYEEIVTDYRDTIFFWYTNGMVSRDSTISNDITNNIYFGTTVNIFTPGGNSTLVRERGYFSLPTTTPDYDMSSALLQTRLNGNLTMEDDTTIFGIKHSFRDHTEASYDNKINPFYKITVHYPINGFDVQKNNLIEERSWDLPRVHERHIRYSYIYRSDGYPLSVTETEMISSGIRKGIFTYTD